MGETLLLLTIITLVVITIRRARPVVLDSPVIIQRPGKYHITLAPQLNRAQVFIEQIAKRFLLSHPSLEGFPSQYFEVRDPIVFAQGQSAYLLAITWRGGMLYFQAANPQPSPSDADSDLNTIREFSETAMAQHPFEGPVNAEAVNEIHSAVDSTAQQLHIAVKTLQASNG